MVEYKCIRCQYTTNIKTHFVDHLNKKETCNVKDNGIDVNPKHILEILSKPLTIIQRIKTILKIDKLEIENNLKIEKLEIENKLKIEKLVIDNKLKIEKLVIEIKKLEKENKELKSTNIVNNNSNSHNTNNINIVINQYNEPNTEYITEKECNQDLKDLNKSFLDMAKKIYFNPSHPENNSIFKTNLKDKFIKCFSDNKWNISSQDTVIDTVIENIKDVFDRYETNYRNYELSNKYDTDNTFKSKVDKSIIIECYNNSKNRNR